MKDLAIALPARGRDLVPLLAQVAQFIEASNAASTRRAYASDLRDFAAFTAAHGLPYLPSGVEVVALYISDLAARVATT